MVDGVTLRYLVKDDMKKVVALDKQCFDFPWSIRVIRRHLKFSGTACIVAECGHTVLGYAIYNIDSDYASIDRIAVDKDVRHAKIGTSLVQKILKVASESNCRIVEAMVYERNLPGQIFFKNLGFRATQTVSDDDGAWYVMARNLGGVPHFKGKPRI